MCRCATIGRIEARVRPSAQQALAGFAIGGRSFVPSGFAPEAEGTGAHGPLVALNQARQEVFGLHGG